MHLFGLTGGLASGKSTVAARLRARGVPVIDADQLARQVVAKGSVAAEEIRAAFGAGMFQDDGELDRKAVADLVFSDPQARARLNAITHPEIAVLSAQCASELRARGEPLACYEAALLVENGLADAFRPLVVVAASEDAQLARAVLRDGASPEEAKKRIAAQTLLSKKLELADLVIRNDGSRVELDQATDRTLAEVCRRTGVPEARYPLR